MPKKTTHDLRQQVGQLLIFGFDGLAMDARLRITLAALQPSGVVLFARNIESPKQTWELLRDCQATAGAPMFLCVDMEGGTVDRLKNVVAPAPAAEAGFTTRNLKLFPLHGNIIWLEPNPLGFNTYFPPLLPLLSDAPP